MHVYRVQGLDGRGPFRPGFSRYWADDDFAPGIVAPPTWMDEFGADAIDRLGKRGEYFGSAVRAIADISKWFSTTEQSRLATMGFNVVSLRAFRILAESPNQVLFARRSPFNVGARPIPWKTVAFLGATASSQLRTSSPPHNVCSPQEPQGSLPPAKAPAQG